MIRNKAGQVVTANLINITDRLPTTSGTVIVRVLGNGGTKFIGAGPIENKGGGTWAYFPTANETNYAAVTFSFYHDDAIRVDVQYNPIVDECPPTSSLLEAGDIPFGLDGPEYSTAAIVPDNPQIPSPLYIGDNYTVALSKAFIFDFIPPVGAILANCSVTFTGYNLGDPSTGWTVSGTLTDNGDTTWRATFELLSSVTSLLSYGYYSWHVSFSNLGDSTTIFSGTNLTWIPHIIPSLTCD